MRMIARRLLIILNVNMALLGLTVAVPISAAQNCAIVAAKSDGTNTVVQVQSRHIGPPLQMRASLSYKNSDGNNAMTNSVPPTDVYRNINTYSLTLPVPSTTISALVTTGVGPSCRTTTMRIGTGESRGTPSFSWADTTSYTAQGQPRCQLRIATFAPVYNWYLRGAPTQRFPQPVPVGTRYWTVWDNVGTCPTLSAFQIPGDPLGPVDYYVSTQYGRF